MPESPLPRVVALSAALVGAAFFAAYLGLGGAIAHADSASLEGLPDATRQQARQLQWAVRLQPWKSSEYMRVGMFYLANNRPAPAIEWLHRATVWGPGGFEPWYYLGLAERASHHIDKAEAAFRKVLQLNPDYIASRFQLANLLMDQGRAKEAEKAYSDLVDTDADQARVAESLGLTWLRQDNYEKAAGSFSEAVRSFSTYGDAHAGLAAALKELGDETRATEEAKLAHNWRFVVPLRIDDPLVERMENDFPTGLSLFQTAARNHDPHSSIGVLEKALELEPSMTYGWEYMISLYGAAHRIKDAERAWDRLKKVDSTNTRGRYELAVAIGQNGGDRIKAAVLLKEALTIDPDFAEAHRALGVVAELEGNRDEAVSQYRAAFEGDPALSEAHVDLGLLLLKSGDMKGGEAELLRALAPPCEDPESILARELKAFGNKQAEAAFEQAVRAQAISRNQPSLISLLNRKKPGPVPPQR